MFIKVLADRRVELEDRNNFQAFKMVVEGHRNDIDGVRQAVAGVAELPDHKTAWVSQEALRRWPGLEANPVWQNALTGMIEKARPYGWIDDERKAIRAHVEWLG